MRKMSDLLKESERETDFLDDLPLADEDNNIDDETDVKIQIAKICSIY